MSGLRRLSLRLALAAGSALVALLGLELCLRAFWDGYYLKVDQPYAMPHPTRGWCNLPDVVVVDGESEFYVTATHDCHGHRGAPVEPARTPGRARVLVLGDSFTYGLGVQDEETFCARLAAGLPGLEVVNAGVNGYGTGQQLLALREEGLAFAPDVVIVGFFANDLADNVSGPTRERFVLEDGELRERAAADASGAKAPTNRPERRRWLRHSFVYRFLSDRMKDRGAAARAAEAAQAAVLSGAPREQAWQLAFALLREIHRTAREHGARMLLLAIPDRAQVEPGALVAGAAGVDRDVQERLRAFAEAEGLPLVDPLPALQAAREALGVQTYYPVDGHLRPEGHVVVARAVSAALAELGWMDDQPIGASEQPAVGH